MVAAGAIFIRLMKRLVRGVFATANVEVTAVHGGCLKQSVRCMTFPETEEDTTADKEARNVEIRASYRLLQTTTAFEEEVVTVNDALIPQEKVLKVSSRYLKSSSFMGRHRSQAEV